MMPWPPYVVIVCLGVLILASAAFGAAVALTLKLERDYQRRYEELRTSDLPLPDDRDEL